MQDALDAEKQAKGEGFRADIRQGARCSRQVSVRSRRHVFGCASASIPTKGLHKKENAKATEQQKDDEACHKGGPPFTRYFFSLPDRERESGQRYTPSRGQGEVQRSTRSKKVTAGPNGDFVCNPPLLVFHGLALGDSKDTAEHGDSILGGLSRRSASSAPLSL